VTTPCATRLPKASRIAVSYGNGRRARRVHTEENSPHQYVKLLASGDVDEILLDAIEDYVKRQKKRLGLNLPKGEPMDVTGLGAQFGSKKKDD
jgi:hypothetical protein